MKAFLILLFSLALPITGFSKSVKIPLKTLPKTGKLGKKLKLWSTYYYTPVYKVGGNYVLRDRNDVALQYRKQRAALSHRQYCKASMEGSVRIRFKGSGAVTYNYAGTGSVLVDCTKYFGRKHYRTGSVRFHKARSTWGDGIGHGSRAPYALIPYRTIAVDKKVIPYGSVIYVPAAVGTKIKLPSGRVFVHDGYFFAGDRGGAIKNVQIDTFVGNSQKRTFGHIKSRASGKFTAYIVKDKNIIRQLTKIHTRAW